MYALLSHHSCGKQKKSNLQNKSHAITTLHLQYNRLLAGTDHLQLFPKTLSFVDNIHPRPPDFVISHHYAINRKASKINHFCHMSLHWKQKKHVTSSIKRNYKGRKLIILRNRMPCTQLSHFINFKFISLSKTSKKKSVFYNIVKDN